MMVMETPSYPSYTSSSAHLLRYWVAKEHGLFVSQLLRLCFHTPENHWTNETLVSAITPALLYCFCATSVCKPNFCPTRPCTSTTHENCWPWDKQVPTISNNDIHFRNTRGPSLLWTHRLFNGNILSYFFNYRWLQYMVPHQVINQTVRKGYRKGDTSARQKSSEISAPESKGCECTRPWKGKDAMFGCLFAVGPCGILGWLKYIEIWYSDL